MISCPSCSTYYTPPDGDEDLYCVCCGDDLNPQRDPSAGCGDDECARHDGHCLLEPERFRPDICELCSSG